MNVTRKLPHPIRRAQACVAAGLLATAALAVFGAAPAPARVQPRITVELGKPVVKDFPKFGSQFPGKPDPATCPPVADFCDTMPVEVPEPKSIARGDDYFLEVTVTWLGGSSNDLDMFLYDNGQTEKEKQDNGGGEPTDPPKATPYTEKIAATDGNGKMTFRLPEPKLVGGYNLVVVNALGTSFGYHLEARIVTEDFAKPFESLEEESDFPFDSSAESEDTAPEDTSLQDNPIGGGDFLTPEGPGAPVLDDVAPAPDDELDGLVRRTRTTEASAETEAALPTASTRPASPPSGLAVLLWFAVLPGALLGGLAYWLIKRRRSGFSFG